MKKYLFLLLAASAIYITSTAQTYNSDEPYMTKSFANATVKNVEVNTSGGSITVMGSNPSETRVEVYIYGNNDRKLTRDEIQQLINENYELTVALNGDKIVAKAKQKNRNISWKKSISISFRVYAPKAVSTDLETSGGSIKLSDLSGNQKFSTSGGSLKVDNLSGKIDGNTSGGSINVSNSHNDIRLSTSGGSIDASNCDGNIKLETSGGSLRLDDLNGTITANTSGGSIKANGIQGSLSTHTSGGSVRLENLSCSVDASTSGGSMDVEIVKLGEYVRLGNSGGNIDLTLPKGSGLNLRLSGNKVNTVSLTNFSGSVEDDNVNGTMNGGGTDVTVRAGSGKINLSLQ